MGINGASLVAQVVKKICLQWGRPGFDPRVGKIPWRSEWLSTPVFLPEKFPGHRSLVGYSPWSLKESDMTERLTLGAKWLLCLWWVNIITEVFHFPAVGSPGSGLVKNNTTALNYNYFTDNGSLGQRSPTFLAPGTGFVEDSFPQTGGGEKASEWFRHITFTVHSISIIITSALPQIISYQILEVGDPNTRELLFTRLYS